ncbi:putative aspartate protein [Neocallimastix lanati (nom. inval.)]|jgi:aspartate aminotransferase|uniref:Putative aspartate protein n=1 Tax=Neocallimastix californiae TaxID=1754190 RepID=A0A1Y2ARP5_9FUNG|nr:putative aspartate protein [Neocallimastix sp. JGI-2020a]ORY24635.1 putative aspartate protein [Neocallimastix californiae]|eukprot:ORY24635.1 putative aspartate protein [Neocallimastix californiae]
MDISQKNSIKRINQIVNHLANTDVESSHFDNVYFAPRDAIFSLTYDYENDPSPRKIDISVGAYRDENGKPWVLPVVKKATKMIISDPNYNHEYLPMDGDREFTDSAMKLILGPNSLPLLENRACGIQTISGTGGLRLCCEFLKRFTTDKIYISDPTWSNHKRIIEESGLEYKYYSYWDQDEKKININKLIDSIMNAPDNSVFLMHACAHNPTGMDPTSEQWIRIRNAMRVKQHIPLFDCAYQGFASGDLNRDAYAVRLFANSGFEMFVAQSFSKNLGLYSERIGCLTMVCSSISAMERCRTQLAYITRALVSNPPAFGAKIATLIINTPELYYEWEENMAVMSGRIIQMRKRFYSILLQLNTPGNWKHIIEQIGPFCYTGLNEKQSITLREKFNIYLTDTGRISVTGLNENNIQYFAESFDWVVRNVH